LDKYGNYFIISFVLNTILDTFVLNTILYTTLFDRETEVYYMIHNF